METEKIDQIIDRHQGQARSLIQILLEIQSENHWLPREALERVCKKLGVPTARIQQDHSARSSPTDARDLPPNERPNLPRPQGLLEAA